jgi:hypothetical protein
MGDPVAMTGIPCRLYQPDSSARTYIADPSTGAISNRDTGFAGVAPEHVMRMQAMGCVLSNQTAFSA